MHLELWAATWKPCAQIRKRTEGTCERLRASRRFTPDSSAIPLRTRHHRTGKDSYHTLGPRKFAEVHNLDIPAIVVERNAKPTMHVEAGCFVTYLEGQRYVLGNTEAGIRPAVRAALQLSSEVRMGGGRLI